MEKIPRKGLLKPFIVSILVISLVLPALSCISSAEGDLIDEILKNVNTLDGEAVFHTDDGRTIKITITKDGEADAGETVNKETQNCEETTDTGDKKDNENKDNLDNILPKVDSIENIFKTLGVWETACELHEKGLTWAHTAEELGFNGDTMYRELQDDIEERLHQARELGLINQEQFEYKFSYYSETALKWVNKIFADTESDTSADLTTILPSLTSIEDVFETLGVWEQAHMLREKGMSWSAIAAELDLTEDIMYRELKDDIEERLHQAKSKGLISYEQYKENLDLYCAEALEWVNKIFAE